MKILFNILFIAGSAACIAQPDLSQLVRKSGLSGSITIYDKNKNEWIYSDKRDAVALTTPDATFNIMHTLIGLDEKILSDETHVLRWDQQERLSKEWNQDMTLETAFQQSVPWYFQEVARKTGWGKYEKYLDKCRYGNGQLGESIEWFWADGSLKISPINQVNLLVDLYEGKLPFSQRAQDIVKQLLFLQQDLDSILRGMHVKGRSSTKDMTWFIGYIQMADNTYFFATRLWKYRDIDQPLFEKAAKELTLAAIKALNVAG